MQEIEEYVDNLRRKINVNKKEILFLCIGTSAIIGDSVGPLVGSYLKKRIEEKKIIGDVNNNICSKKDLMYYYPRIKNKFIIAIDSAISSRELEGEIFINNTPITMGLGVNKNKGIIGDISIKASIPDLDTIDKQYVKNISEIIGKVICCWYL